MIESPVSPASPVSSAQAALPAVRTGYARLPLRPVAGAALSAINRLVAGGRWTSSDGVRRWRVGIADRQAWRERQDDILLAVDWDGVRACLVLSPPMAEALLAPECGALLWRDLPSDLGLALIQHAIDRLAGASAAGSPAASEGAFPCVEGWMSPESAAALPYLLEVGAASGAEGERILGRILIDLPGLRRLAEQAVAEPPDEWLAAWNGIPLPVVFELGWVDLPLNELQSIRLQDVLLPDGWWDPEDKKAACLRIGPRIGIAVRFPAQDGQCIAIKVKNMEQESGIAVSNDAASALQFDALQLGEVPIRLTFDLGERSMTLRELNGVAAGYLFDLGLPPDRAVNLRINGVRVGEGELIDIDGRVGVAVTRIAPPHL